jgi:hypothetical protein
MGRFMESIETPSQSTTEVRMSPSMRLLDGELTNFFRRFAFLYRIHPAESFPLILGICIFFQQILFIGVQASSFNSIMITNCRNTAQFILPGTCVYKIGMNRRLIPRPAIFVLGYLNLVFGLEMTIRGLRGMPFAKRHRWTNRICLLTVTLMLVVTFVIARTVMPSDEMCFGNLVFRASALGLNRTVIGLLSVTMALFMAMATVIGLQLLRTVQIDPNERVAGSRMVYYLVATTITYVSPGQPAA